MNCKDFEYWLSVRKNDRKPSVPDNILDHVNTCKECSQIYLLDNGLESAVNNYFSPVDLPHGLEQRVQMTLDHAQPPKTFSWIKAGAAAAIFIFLFTAGVFSVYFKQQTYKNLQQISEAAVASHLKANTAMSFSAQDVKTALTMLSRELQFNVMVPDLKDQGYTLLGGRLCALGKCKIAYLFYQKEKNISSLIIMDDNHLDFEMTDGSRFTSTVHGLHSDVWKENGQIYAMVY